MSIGSVPSFYQQDQDYWQKAQAQSQVSSADASLISVMGQAETNLAKGLASIANGTALKRVNSQLTAAIQSVLDPSSSSTSSSSSGSTSSTSSSSPSSSSSSSGKPATGTGTVPLTTGTSLQTLGIPAKATITISAASNATTYTSTGTDTVGDLISAINVDLPTNAQVTASLNSRGDLVITSRNDADTINIGGTYASNIGFAASNNTFEPTKPSSGSSSSSTSSTGASSSTATSSSASSSSKSSSTAKSTQTVSSIFSENASTAASLLTASGVSGSLVDMLA